MTDRWSNPSASVGDDRFRVWPAGTDSYSHSDMAANWDMADDIIGNSPSGNWPPTLGINGGIYAVCQDLQAQITTLDSKQPVLYGTYALLPSPGSTTDGTVYVTTDTGAIFQLQAGTWKLLSQKSVTVTPGTMPTSPYDGQVIDVVDNTGNPTYRWRFVYNASRPDANKWEFVGGSEWISMPALRWSAPLTAGGDWYNSATAFTIPLSGTYQFYAQAVGWMSGQNPPGYGNLTATVQFYVGGQAGLSTSLQIGNAELGGNRGANTDTAPVHALLTCSQGDTVAFRGNSSGYNASNYEITWVSIKPVRLA